MKTNIIRTFLLCVGLLAGCVGGPTKDFYKPTGAVPMERFGERAALVESRDIHGDVNRHVGLGYQVLGSSDYLGKYPEVVELTTQAKKVGASVVIFTTRHVDTITGVNSFSLPNPPQTIQSQTYANVYGYGGAAQYSGTTTTTVPGGYSQYQVPYVIDRFEVHAVFLGK